VRLEQSFVPVEGVGETTERRLWDAGVTSWDAFGRDLNVRGVGPTTADRIESFVAEAPARLDRRDGQYFEARLPSSERFRMWETFRDEAVCFDIETTGLDPRGSVVTTVSATRGDETTTLVRGDDLTAARVRALLDAPLLVTFNGRQFDVPFLEREFDLSLDAAHLDLRYPCSSLGLSGGLKRVERELGVERDRPDLSGRDAVRLWREHERGDEGALSTLVSYNRDDARNLRALADEASARLHDERAGDVLPR
jgi:uncharacterized protein YprB with RNaseH-like and TPR domain